LSWVIEHTDEFEEWLLDCDQDTQEAVAAMFPLLRERGPQLSHPFADTLQGSKRFYKQLIRKADLVYDQHLEEIKHG